MCEGVSSRLFNDLHLPTKRSNPLPPSEDPYIYTPYITKTILDLLGITSQVPENEISEGFKIEFPSILEIYDRTEAGGCFQWPSQGWYGGKLVGPSLSRFSSKISLTKRNEIMVARAVLEGRVLGIWRYVSGCRK
jgi:hypothetical protein